MKNSGIMAIGGAPWAPVQHRPKATPLFPPRARVYDSSLLLLENGDKDCLVCGFHVCACAPLPGFEHFGRLRKEGPSKRQCYIRLDKSVGVYRADSGWKPASLKSTVPEAFFPTPQEAMRFCDAKWPKVHPHAIPYKAPFISSCEPLRRREYMGEWDRAIGPGGQWEPVLVAGHDAWKHPTGATLVQRLDMGPNSYYANGWHIQADTIEQAAARSLYLHAIHAIHG